MKKRNKKIITVAILSAFLMVSGLQVIASTNENLSFSILENKSNQPPYPPVAIFDFIPENPFVNDTVTFDASESYYPAFDDEVEGEIIGYRWDLDDDGVFDDATGEIIEYSWSVEGTYFVALKVLGNFGLNDSIRSGVDVYKSTELTIQQISSENGVISTTFTNIGPGFCTIDWSISVNSILTNFISEETDGTWVIESGDTEKLSMDEAITGFGFVTIVVEADAVNIDKVSAEINAFVFGQNIFLM